MKVLLLALFVILMVGCITNAPPPATSDVIQSQQQQVLLQEGTAQTGMPAIKNFRERKLMKDILEMRDQTGLVTYTYLWNELGGKWVFFCDSIGYPLPYAAQYTNPTQSQLATGYQWGAAVTLSQADPNGLFSPASAEGTWVMCASPDGAKTAPTYIEPRVITTQWKLP